MPRAVPFRYRRHGIEVADEFAWLRAVNWQEVIKSPEKLAPGIREYLEAENAYTAAILKPTEALQRRLFKEMKGRIKEDDSSPPSPDGPWAYLVRYAKGKQYPIMWRRPRDGGAESVLLDANRLARGQAYFDLGATAHSPDHRLLAYAVDYKGSEFYSIRFRDLSTGSDLPNTITDARGDVVWSSDGREVLWTSLDASHRPVKVFRHRLGTPQSEDDLIYEERDPSFFVSLGETQSRRFALVNTSDHETSEVRVLEQGAWNEPPRLIARRKKGHRYAIEHRPAHPDGSGGEFLILTNAGGALDNKIVSAPVADPRLRNWRDVVPHREGRLILDAAAFSGHLARLEREDGLPRIVIRPFAGGAEFAIAFDEEAYSLGFHPGYEFETTVIRFTYSSMTSPAATYDYDMRTRKRTLIKVEEIPSGHDRENYVTRRVMAPAPDGELVPVSILYRKGLKLDGSAPMLLYGYGSYGITMPAAFSGARLSLVDRGFVFALAHVRGGRDKGERWYLDGKKAKKHNTFTDFIAAGEYLAGEGFTSRGRIIAQGGSAGGMLMGAVANIRPSLFLGIIAEVPFVDVLATMLDDSLPLTPIEWPEWGNPIKSAADFKRIRAYSPYDNIKAQAYPHMLALAGLTDPRVTYWEAAKWVARLRHRKTDDNLLLMRVNMDAGHRGASGRFDRLKEVALAYAFALEIAGLRGALPLGQ
ncbi:MAG: S9 family peptidase [Hyphomicrobiaceae bacterium]|nr:MAG: S9 family peptidase [Hyphomicrobiaceae bacterium]